MKMTQEINTDEISMDESSIDNSRRGYEKKLPVKDVFNRIKWLLMKTRSYTSESLDDIKKTPSPTIIVVLGNCSDTALKYKKKDYLIMSSNNRDDHIMNGTFLAEDFTLYAIIKFAKDDANDFTILNKMLNTSCHIITVDETKLQKKALTADDIIICLQKNDKNCSQSQSSLQSENEGKPTQSQLKLNLQCEPPVSVVPLNLFSPREDLNVKVKVKTPSIDDVKRPIISK